jgi:hypothetical protein
MTSKETSIQKLYKDLIETNASDEWGGIDKKIQSSVLGLNLRGIKTTGSCEGDHAPCPWIMVKSGSKSVKEKFDRLLNEFYRARKTSDNAKIKVFFVGPRFYIYSGKRKTFADWRKSVNDAAKMIARGKSPKFGTKTVALTEYQHEFSEFGKFLLAQR